MRRAITTIRTPASAAQFRMVRSLHTCLIVLLAIGATDLAAQPDEARRPNEERRSERRERSPFGGGPPPKLDSWRVLELPSVRTELGLDQSQLSELGQLRAEMRKPKSDDKNRADRKRSWENLNDEERKEKFEELKRESKKKRELYEARLKEILNETQVSRMQEIQLQIRGIAALFDAKVADELGLTTSQRDKIHESIRSSMREAMHDYFKTERSQRKMSMRDKMQEIRPAVEAKALEVLTEEQSAEFKAMKGKAFKIPDAELRRRGRPPKSEKKNSPGGPPRGTRGDQADKEKKEECGARRK